MKRDNYTVFVNTNFFYFLVYHSMLKNRNKQILNSSRRIIAFIVGITILNQKIIYKDDITIVTEFPCLLGHPVFIT